MRCVRNFWVVAGIDGRVGTLRGGPRARDGGLRVFLYQRVEGSPELVVEIDCSVPRPDELRLDVVPKVAEVEEREQGGLVIVSRR